MSSIWTSSHLLLPERAGVSVWWHQIKCLSSTHSCHITLSTAAAATVSNLKTPHDTFVNDVIGHWPLSLVPPSSMVICSASSDKDSSMVWLERSVNDRRFLIRFIFSIAGQCKPAANTHTRGRQREHRDGDVHTVTETVIFSFSLVCVCVETRQKFKGLP